MFSVLRTVIFALALAGGGLVSQLPEFAQQYRQRLGGALGEIQRIVSDFDKDAQRSNLSREEALALYGRSAEPFIRDRGLSMTAVLERHAGSQGPGRGPGRGGTAVRTDGGSVRAR